jgi:hypothetical protein
MQPVYSAARNKEILAVMSARPDPLSRASRTPRQRFIPNRDEENASRSVLRSIDSRKTLPDHFGHALGQCFVRFHRRLDNRLGIRLGHDPTEALGARSLAFLIFHNMQILTSGTANFKGAGAENWKLRRRAAVVLVNR